MRRHLRDADDLRLGCERRRKTAASCECRRRRRKRRAGAAAAQPVTFEKFVKEAELADGLFTVIRKDGKIYLAIDKEQLDTEFYEHATTANGLGGFGVLSGDDFEQPARIIKFERINPKNVAIVLPQYRFDARPGSALETAIKASAAESVQTVAPIAAEDKATGRVAIDASFLLRDSLDFANALSDVVKNPEHPQGAYHQTPDRSYFGPSKAFPENVIIEADQTYASEKPDTINTVTNPHSISMRVKYNFSDHPQHARLRAATRRRPRRLLAGSASQFRSRRPLR